ncbi:unnamed protein product [Heligmosomoides polygyrus]|uniref:glucuronosyltransferase n=1 Tax=Heligmosomoides polygyrus TaxID=6339 RepID=A0A3P8DEZ3_HELPZ|nr:unnamed protein product [Heligmosomoides polygyrus]
MISNGRIADELASAGHEVVLLEPDFLSIFDKVNSSKVARRWPVFGFSSVLHDVLQGLSGAAFEEASLYKQHQGILIYQRAYNELCEDLLSRHELIEKLRAEKFDGYFGEQINLCGNGLSGAAFEEASLYKQHQGILIYQRAYNELCEDLLSRHELIEKLRAEKFDGYFGEQINLCGNGLAHVLGIKAHFWISSCPIGDHMAWILGMPQPSSYIPSLIGMDITNRPTYFERVLNIWASFLYIYFGIQIAQETTEVFRRKYGPNFPNLEDVAANSDVVFVSTDEFIEFPRPTLPNVVHIGGIGFKDAVEDGGLDELFSEQLEKGSKGVVYFSMGTLVNTSSLPPFAINAVMETIRRTPDHHFVLVADRHDQVGRSIGSNQLSPTGVVDWSPRSASEKLCPMLAEAVMRVSRRSLFYFRMKERKGRKRRKSGTVQ